MKENMIPAPIDNKNVTEDWIEEVFDGCNCVWYTRMAVGFIDGYPVLAWWHDNVLCWTFVTMTREIDSEKRMATLRGRLAVYDEENPELVTICEASQSEFVQRFYWREDEP